MYCTRRGRGDDGAGGVGGLVDGGANKDSLARSAYYMYI